MRAKLPRRRVVRAWVGVLEDVRGAVGDGRGSAICDESACGWFIRYEELRGRVVRDGGPVAYDEAPWRFSTQHTRLAEQSCKHVSRAKTA